MSTPPRLDRRRFLATLAAASATLAVGCDADDRPLGELHVSAQGADGYTVAAAGRAGRLRSVPTDFRGHGLAWHPLRPDSVLMVARRPGTAVVEVDLRAGRIRRRFEVAPDRLLCGHACFSADGQTVFTTEVDAHTGEGRVGVRDARSYRPLGELDTAGLGPHELALMPDGRTLVVANGGLLTLPETGREVLNLDTMDPSLVYLDLGSGAVVDQVRFPQVKASVRHLAVASDGTVAVATQVQRAAMTTDDLVPLGALHRRGEALRMLTDPAPVIGAMDDYMGSVAISEASRIAGFTSPRGDLAAFWRLDDGAFVGHHRFADVCGLAVSADQQRFALSNSLGELRWLDAHTLTEDRAARRNDPGQRWDNHMITVVL